MVLVFVKEKTNHIHRMNSENHNRDPYKTLKINFFVGRDIKDHLTYKHSSTVKKIYI